MSITCVERSDGVMDDCLNFVGFFSLNNSNISRLICGFEGAISVLFCGRRFRKWLPWEKGPIQRWSSRGILLAPLGCSLNLHSSHGFASRRNIPDLWIRSLSAGALEISHAVNNILIGGLVLACEECQRKK